MRHWLAILAALFGFFTLAPTAHAQEPFLGEVRMFAGNFAPRGWALCEGQLLPISQNDALFSILGTIYGGDGRTTFALPDLRGRVPVHPGTGPGLSSVTLGQRFGSETISQVPSHTHTLQVSTGQGSTDAPAGSMLANPAIGGTGPAPDRATARGFTSPGASAGLAAASITATGAANGVNIRPPSLGIHFIIALQGLYPSRN